MKCLAMSSRGVLRWIVEVDGTKLSAEKIILARVKM